MTTVLEPTAANVRRAAAAVRDGDVVVAPSDTNLALTLDPWDGEAVERAYEIKDRPAHKPLTLFVRDPDDWREYGRHDDPEVVDTLAEAFWPGPLNLVLERRPTVPHDRLTMDGTVAVGCLANPVWRELTAHLDRPVAMTSANQSGTVEDDELVDVATAVDHVGDAVECVLAGAPQGTTRASTILDLTDGSDGEATVIRDGDRTREELADASGLSIS